VAGDGRDDPVEAWVPARLPPRQTSWKQKRLAAHFSFSNLKNGQSLQGWASSVVDNDSFNYAIGFLVFLNVVAIGAEADYMAKNIVDVVPLHLRAVECVFCVVFVAEIALRIFAERSQYFCAAGSAWNVFDLAVVSLHVAEVLLDLAGILRDSLQLNSTFLRVFRTLRVVRVVRSIRIMRLVGELRTLAASLKWSLSSLAWTVALLLMIIVSVGICLTQVVTDYRVGHQDTEPQQGLATYYGSLGCTVLSLYQAITGGIDWNVAVTPLADSISPVWSVVFSLYIAFVVFAVLNIVTGVFVQSSLENSKDDTDWVMIRNISSLIATIQQQSQVDSFSWVDFQQHLDRPQMRAYFEAIDVDPSEAEGVFKLLDLNGNGSIDTDEFLSGCLRLRGPAKALDLALLMHEVRRMAIQVGMLVEGSGLERPAGT
jgi:hypothetical protein